MPVIRSILAVVAGFVAASVVMMTVEWTNGHFLYPDLAKQAEGVTDREIIRAILARAPLGAMLVVLAGWALGSLVGALLTASIARNAPLKHALILGSLLTLAGIANNLMLPPPAWFWLPTLVVFLPTAYVGARLVAGKAVHATTPRSELG